MRQVHLIVSGKVQNVWFRAETKKKADSLGVVGWVKNLDSGEVEVYASGPETKLKELVQWCHQGPPKARVVQVKVEWDINVGSFHTFEIVE